MYASYRNVDMVLLYKIIISGQVIIVVGEDIDMWRGKLRSKDRKIGEQDMKTHSQTQTLSKIDCPADEK